MPSIYLFFILPKQNFPLFPLNVFSLPAKNFPEFFFPLTSFNSHTFVTQNPLLFSLSRTHVALYLTHTLGTVNHSQTHPPSRAQPSIRHNRFIVALKWQRFEALQ